MTDFEMLVAPHRVARRYKIAERFEAAVAWAESQLRQENPSPTEVARKLRTGVALSRKEAELAANALDPKPKMAGRPQTVEGRNLSLRLLVNLVAREFLLKPTRGNESRAYSAADAVAEAMRRVGLAPSSFDRVRKLYAQAKLDEERQVKLARKALFAQLESPFAAAYRIALSQQVFPQGENPP